MERDARAPCLFRRRSGWFPMRYALQVIRRRDRKDGSSLCAHVRPAHQDPAALRYLKTVKLVPPDSPRWCFRHTAGGVPVAAAVPVR